MTLVAPRIVNSVSYVTRINHEIHFSWQAQYLVKFKCHFSWQAQYSVKFGMIAGARNVWGQRHFVSLCLVCLASAFASERTSLILPIYQRYNWLLCCVISCPSV